MKRSFGDFGVRLLPVEIIWIFRLSSFSVSFLMAHNCNLDNVISSNPFDNSIPLMKPFSICLTHFIVPLTSTERGRKLYPRRVAIVEPVFANIRAQKRLDRFTLRGKIKVTIQWLLYCMVHNIEKIANFGPEFAVV